ncbi:MAG: class I SAM-dependent methyltransferase, partial [Oligoflexales bacterium]|nr:class I SAM-dependent methyltransferase [Oligoflexales bacterium]
DLALKDAFTLLAPDSNMQILDAGCGSGRLLFHAKDFLKKGGQLTGIDIDDEGLNTAKKRAHDYGINKSVNFINADLLSFGDPSLPLFDGIISNFAIYTLSEEKDRILFLSNIAKFLKPKGRMVVGLPSETYNIKSIIGDALSKEKALRGSFSPIYHYRKHFIYPKAFTVMMPIEKAIDGGRFHKFSTEEISSLFVSAGFKRENIKIWKTYGGNGYHVLAIKE